MQQAPLNYDGPGRAPPPDVPGAVPEEHTVSFAPERVSREQSFSEDHHDDSVSLLGFPDDSNGPHPQHHHHHHHHHKHSKWKRVCTALASVFTIILLGVTAGAMYYMNITVDVFPTELAAWADFIILYANSAGVFVHFMFLCVAGCCHDLFRHGPLGIRWMALILFDVLLLATLLANGFTLYSLIMINEQNVQSYTWDYGVKQAEDVRNWERQWPRYIPKLHFVTHCSGRVIPSPNNMSVENIKAALKNCSVAYKLLLQLQPPKTLADQFGKEIEGTLRTNTTDVKDKFKKQGKTYIYTIYGVWLGVIIITALVCVICVASLILFNHYVITHINQHHKIHPKKTKKKKEKTGAPGESSSSSDSYSDSLDEKFTADIDDKRRAVKRFLLHRHDEDSMTDIVRIKTRDGVIPEVLADRLARAVEKGGQGVQGQGGTTGGGTADDIGGGGGATGAEGPMGPNQAGGFSPMQQDPGIGPGFDPRYQMQPQFYGPGQAPQIHFIQLPGGESRPATPGEAVGAPQPQQPGAAPNVILNPQFTINRSRRKVGNDDDDDDDDDDDGGKKKKKKKSKKKKSKKKKSKKKKKKKKKGKKKKKKKSKKKKKKK